MLMAVNRKIEFNSLKKRIAHILFGQMLIFVWRLKEILQEWKWLIGGAVKKIMSMERGLAFTVWKSNLRDMK